MYVCMYTQGVIQDYREAERLPCQAAVALQGLAAAAAAGARDEARNLAERVPHSTPAAAAEAAAAAAWGLTGRLVVAVLRLLDQKDAGGALVCACIGYSYRY